MGQRWENPPCNCKWCNVCAMAGIAYPLKRQPPAEPADDEPADPPRTERRPAPATLFDQLELEARE